ncbi:MAG: hypothetical protein HOI23_12220 [Deltaproteobacteria bacterium]|nr:hypothetical protein [Deltaproteobacteria bacterium]MBT6432800.1 hypothetical protein [Deltaproteobacteria bacterium]MBT6488271.1 hypothetical protein [Deltaproteobacteria bacterium]
MDYIKSMGRTTKLTTEIQETILSSLRMGSTRAHAAAYAGISKRFTRYTIDHCNFTNYAIPAKWSASTDRTLWCHLY